MCWDRATLDAGSLGLGFSCALLKEPVCLQDYSVPQVPSHGCPLPLLPAQSVLQSGGLGRSCPSLGSSSSPKGSRSRCGALPVCSTTFPEKAVVGDILGPSYDRILLKLPLRCFLVFSEVLRGTSNSCGWNYLQLLCAPVMCRTPEVQVPPSSRLKPQMAATCTHCAKAHLSPACAEALLWALLCSHHMPLL